MKTARFLTAFIAMALMATLATAQEPEHRQTRGTLVMMDDSSVVVNTDDGQVTYQVVSRTVLPKPDAIEVGDAVIVDWNVGETEDDLPWVRTVRLDHAAMDMDHDMDADMDMEADADMDMNADADMDADMEMNAEADMEMEADMDADADMEMEADVEMEANADMDDDMDVNAEANTYAEAETTTNNTRTSLPQTGSSQPLAALLGLLALIGALSLAVLRRS